MGGTKNEGGQASLPPGCFTFIHVQSNAAVPPPRGRQPGGARL